MSDLSPFNASGKIDLWSRDFDKRYLCAKAQELSARWYSEARGALESGDLALAIERQAWGAFRSKCARAELLAILEAT